MATWICGEVWVTWMPDALPGIALNWSPSLRIGSGI